MARAGLIAAVYVVLCWVLAPISFRQIQVRVAEGLTLLPILYPEAIPALFVGALLANIIGGLGPWDIFGGSLVTLLAAYLTRVFRFRPAIAYLSPILLNALLVSLYLHYILPFPYWPLVLSIGIGEAIAVLGIGLPLLKYLKGKGLGTDGNAFR
ncbi:MAG: QueT transporter family protein [Syntrophothermus sp.]